MVTGDHISWSIIEIKMDLEVDYTFKMSQFKPLIRTKLVHSSPFIYRAQVFTSITVLKIRGGEDTWIPLKLKSTSQIKHRLSQFVGVDSVTTFLQLFLSPPFPSASPKAVINRSSHSLF